MALLSVAALVAGCLGTEASPTLSEDTVQHPKERAESPASLSSSSLPLNSYLGCQPVNKNGYFIVQDGITTHNLSLLVPYKDLLAPTSTIMMPTETPVYRAIVDNGQTIIQAQKEGDGSVIYAEIRSLILGISDIFFVTPENGECKASELLVFTSEQISFEALFSDAMEDEFDDEDLIEFPVSLNNYDNTRIRSHRRLEPIDEAAAMGTNNNLPNFVYERGDGTSLECTYFKVVKIGIVYDSEFCTWFAGDDNDKTKVRDRIMMIVATASLFYENDMCVKLQITDIYSPDECSVLPSPTFGTFPRDEACGNGNSETFIRYFKDWMNDIRQSLEFDEDAAFHAFTGIRHRGTLGCGFVGTACRHPRFAYGVEYMGTSSLMTQSIILAHEVGHNLSARHLSSEQAGRFRYVMNPTNRGAYHGFSQITIDKILDYLHSDQVTCDTVEIPEVLSPPATTGPSFLPSSMPSQQPSFLPTVYPSAIPSESLTCQTLEPDDYIPSCVSARRDGSYFKCYDTIELILRGVQRRVIPGRLLCPDDSNGIIMSLRFQSCELQEPLEDSVGSNDRDLMGEEENGHYEEKAEVKRRMLLNDLDVVTESLKPDDCDKGCAISFSGNRVCVDATLSRYELERTYEVEVYVTCGGGGGGGGGSTGLSRCYRVSLSVERSYLTGQACDVAEAVCSVTP